MAHILASYDQAEKEGTLEQQLQQQAARNAQMQPSQYGLSTRTMATTAGTGSGGGMTFLFRWYSKNGLIDRFLLFFLSIFPGLIPCDLIDHCDLTRSSPLASRAVSTASGFLSHAQISCFLFRWILVQCFLFVFIFVDVCVFPFSSLPFVFSFSPKCFSLSSRAPFRLFPLVLFSFPFRLLLLFRIYSCFFAILSCLEDHSVDVAFHVQQAERAHRNCLFYLSSLFSLVWRYQSLHKRRSFCSHPSVFIDRLSTVFSLDSCVLCLVFVRVSFV